MHEETVGEVFAVVLEGLLFPQQADFAAVEDEFVKKLNHNIKFIIPELFVGCWGNYLMSQNGVLHMAPSSRGGVLLSSSRLLTDVTATVAILIVLCPNVGHSLYMARHTREPSTSRNCFIISKLIFIVIHLLMCEKYLPLQREQTQLFDQVIQRDRQKNVLNPNLFEAYHHCRSVVHFLKDRHSQLARDHHPVVHRLQLRELNHSRHNRLVIRRHNRVQVHEVVGVRRQHGCRVVDQPRIRRLNQRRLLFEAQLAFDAD